jgi:hypothetical protein
MNYGSRLLKLGVTDSRAERVVFDSGSSFTYFTQQAYSDLVASVSVHSLLESSRISYYMATPLNVLITCYPLMQLEEVNGFGLIQDTSDPTLPVCWRARLPIRYDSKCG